MIYSVQKTEAPTDQVVVEVYIRANIKTLAPESPVLGSSWYVLEVRVDPETKTGTMSYEDGHIQGSASFSYTRTKNQVTIMNLKKLLLR